MSEAEVMVWKNAGDIARVAMGRRKQRSGRHVDTVWIADEDPLAWWCLTELMVTTLAQRRPK